MCSHHFVLPLRNTRTTVALSLLVTTRIRSVSPLQSRCSNFDFTLKKSDALELQGQFFLRVKKILKENGVTAEDKVLVKLIQKHYPDWRRCLNELQRHAASGEIDSGILTDVGELDVSQLVKALKGKEFNTVRQWVVENLDNEPNIILRKVYDVLSTVLVGQSVPQLVLIIAEYQYKSKPSSLTRRSTSLLV